MSPRLFISFSFFILSLSTSVSTSHQISHPRSRPFLLVSAVYTSPSITAHNLIWKGKWPYERERVRWLRTGSMYGKRAHSVDVQNVSKRNCFWICLTVKRRADEKREWRIRMGQGNWPWYYVVNALFLETTHNTVLCTEEWANMWPKITLFHDYLTSYWLWLPLGHSYANLMLPSRYHLSDNDSLNIRNLFTPILKFGHKKKNNNNN